MKQLIGSFIRDTAGNFAMIAALATPVLLLLTAGAMDLARYRTSVDELQKVADFAAIAGAREMVLANSNAASIETAVLNVIQSRMGSKFSGDTYTKLVDVRMDEGEVTVDLSIQIEGMLGQSLFPDNGLVKADSNAIATGSAKICVISLSPERQRSFFMSSRAKIQADGCSFYVNSAHTEAVYLKDASKVYAEVLCSSGGARYGSRNETYTSILTDCPSIEDPLKDRRPPQYPVGCRETNLELGDIVVKEEDEDEDAVIYDSIESMEFSESAVLSPGVYCGGITIGQNIEVEFEPGTYVIQEGPFIVDRNSHVYGEGVGFYFTGDDSYFDFLEGSAVTFSAPETGDMAGMLFMEDRNKSRLEEHRIATHLADELLGTIYLPKGRIFVKSPSS
ncbi:MAG: pilus assembly protein, partial [Aquisalinus sp.]|nr:pilus assembly protein [Aquisalinus sp.]